MHASAASFDVVYIRTDDRDIEPYRAAVTDAVAFWRAPITIHREIIVEGSAPYVFDSSTVSDIKTLFIVIGNEHIIFGSTPAIAFSVGAHAYVSTAPVVASYSQDIVLRANIAHELGHILFNLPDLYFDYDCAALIDIMCGANTAYQANFIGCITLETLGRPCTSLYLPALQLAAQ